MSKISDLRLRRTVQLNAGGFVTIEMLYLKDNTGERRFGFKLSGDSDAFYPFTLDDLTHISIAISMLNKEADAIEEVNK